MCVYRFSTCVHLISLFIFTQCDQQLSLQRDSSDQPWSLSSQTVKSRQERSDFFDLNTHPVGLRLLTVTARARSERDVSDAQQSTKDEIEESSSNFDEDEIRWTNINEEVDMVIPMVLAYLQKQNIEYLRLADMKESISLNVLFMTYETSLVLSNGIVYNMAGIRRYGDAAMTYQGKSFLTRFHLIVKSLQFEYNFVLKIMGIEGYGKVIGSLDDAIIYSELAVEILTSKLNLFDFRVLKFRNINVQLDQIRIIRAVSGAILSPITNLFKDRITTSISDGLKDQIQLLMNDFNNEDPLELRQFTKKMLSGLTGKIEHLE